VTTTSAEGYLELSVHDNGIGIASSEKEKIFDKFYRVPTGNVHNAKGFGLGLSYVKRIVEKHLGRISVQSVPGAGSTFRITLPTIS
jgi:two-component system phosphate regulon sensor histidine kinase PhoR